MKGKNFVDPLLVCILSDAALWTCATLGCLPWRQGQALALRGLHHRAVALLDVVEVLRDAVEVHLLDRCGLPLVRDPVPFPPDLWPEVYLMGHHSRSVFNGTLLE